jgi:acyl transferase domain-containing protein
MVDSLTGVFVGLTHGDYQLLAADAHAVEAPYGFTGSSFSPGVRADRLRVGSTVPRKRWTPHVRLV